MIPINSNQGSDCGECPQCNQPPEKHCCTPTYRRNKIIQRVSYDKFLPNVRVLAPEIPDAILLDYIRQACIDFAIDSKILTRNIQLDLHDCVADYYPCLGEQEQINSVRLLSVNGTCYKSVGDTCNWNVGNNKFYFHPPNSLEIHPPPKVGRGDCSDGNTVILTVIAVPTQDSSEVDKIIHDNYFNGIVNHAVGTCHLIPDTPITAGEAHTYRMNEYKKTVNKAKVAMAQNYSSGLQSLSEIKGGCDGCLF